MVIFCMGGLSGRQTTIDSKFWKGRAGSAKAKGSFFFGLKGLDWFRLSWGDILCSDFSDALLGLLI